MTEIKPRIGTLSASYIHGMRRGVEKESLRTQASGVLATTPHPQALGSALTHPHITTDFSESQLELITGIHADVDSCLEELKRIQQFTQSQLGEELLWVSSMPCDLPTDDAIPLGQYGTSNVGRAKTIYRMGLGHRYGRRMQTISGIHYNWSLPDVRSEDYFGLIRNFRRHAFLLLYLFGASPAVCSSFVPSREGGVPPHGLQTLNDSTLFLPYATSLRMGRLGYQSDAQSALAVSYNGLQGYWDSLYAALTTPYPPYQAIGVQAPDGSYQQLANTLLQIENEFYGTIRPKRVIRPGERPLHALRQRGVEYVEVRLMDLDPFEPVGISAQTMRFLDVFLLHCLLRDSPPDTPEEIAAMSRNQHLTAQRGREPGLQLERVNGSVQGRVDLREWGLEIVAQLRPIAQQLDNAYGGTGYAQAIEYAQHGLQNPDTLPSARVLRAMNERFDGSFMAFARAQSASLRDAALTTPLTADVQADLERMARDSVAAQRQQEQADAAPGAIAFAGFLQQYLSPQGL